MLQQRQRGSTRSSCWILTAIAVTTIITVGLAELPAYAQSITINLVQSHTNTPAYVGGAGTALTACDSPTVTIDFEFSGFTNESHTVTLQIGTTSQIVASISGASGSGVTRDFTSAICGETEGQIDYDITLSDSTFGDQTQTATNAVELDVTAPAAPSTPDLTAGTDSGSSSSDDITNNTTPAFTGTAEADSTVTLTSSVNGSVGTGTATGGNYSIVSSALTGSFAGTSHTMTATTQDVAGNVSTASSGLSITIDTGINAPSTPDMNAGTDSGSSNNDDITNDQTPTFDGTAEVDSTVTLSSSINGSVGTGAATGGNYSITTSTLTGSILGTGHSITASAVDVAGNSSSNSDGLSVTMDNGINAPTTPDLTPSTDSGTFNNDDLTNDQTPTFTGTSETGSTVTITSSVNGSVGTGSATGGNYSITVSTLDGSAAGTAHSMTASAVDIAGNSSVASGGLSLTIDNFANPPSAPNLIAGDDSGTSNTDDITNIQTPTFDGTAEADAVVTLFSSLHGPARGTGTATGGNWSITANNLVGGAASVHQMTATQTDLAGNTSASSTALQVTVDTVAPAGFSESITAPTFTGGGIVYVTSTANTQLAASDLSVDATDSSGSGTGIDSCQIQIDGGGFNSYGTVSGGALNGDTFNLPSPDGPKGYDINCTDVAGNTSSNFSRTRTVDDTAPTIGNPRHQNTTCYPTANCNASNDIVVNTFVKSLTQASITPSYPSVPVSTFDYPSYSDPLAGANPGSGIDTCALTGTQSDTGNYTAGVNFSIAIGDGVKNFSLSCDDNLGNNNTLDSPDLQVDDTAPVVPNNFSHDNTTCYPFANCIGGSEIVIGGTYVKAQDKQPFFPQNPYLPDYPQFIPKSAFQWEQSDAGGTIDDPISGGVMSGLRDCVLTGGTTQDNTIVSPPFSNVFNLQAIDGAYTVRDNCRDNLGNQAFTDGATINVDDTPPATSFGTSGPRYNDPVDGVIFVESNTEITPILSDGGVGVDLGGIGGAPADIGPTNPACLQNIDERNFLLQPCLMTFSFRPPDEDHHLWIMRPDLLGNVAETQFTFIVDDTYPVIELERPFEGDTFLLNSIITAEWSVNDEGLTFFDDVEDAQFAPGLNKRGSGIRSVVATTPSGVPIDTDDIAVHSFTITVTDNLGHTTALTISYRTVLDFRLEQNLRSVLENDGFKLGEMLEFRFSLTDVNGLLFSGVSPVITLFGPDDEPIDIGDDRRADYDDELGLYIFPIDTSQLVAGTYTILVEVGDGEFHEVEFDLIE